ncbi:MAG: hypothetical protein E7085_08285 [Parabacteroides distasonis]|nr:hypothetical protein [Parabacteroides distasonis]
MNKSVVFSWAEDVNGKMVHVDNVPNGLKCKCFCPCCHEELLARHGDIREHGFAHQSKKRKANLDICYMVTLYKLAEHILQTKKRIHVPSYYGIYKETDIEFTDVKVDNRYEREDKQPDVIATTRDNQQYLIEFIFRYKVQHKKDIDYHNFSCLEVDLTGQRLESLEKFLMTSNQNRRWINNDNYFNQIETIYHKAKKLIKIIPEQDCSLCELIKSCCAIKERFSHIPLRIENNGQVFRICKINEYNHQLKVINEQRLRDEQRTKVNELKNVRCRQHNDSLEDALNIVDSHSSVKKSHEEIFQVLENVNESLERSCFDCEINLSWANKGGMANCGCYGRLGIKPTVDPNYAKNCSMFKRKNK